MSGSTSFAADLAAFLAAHPPPPDDGRFETRLAWQRTLHAHRWVAPRWPAAHGGRDASYTDVATYISALAAAHAPPVANPVGVNTVGPVLLAHGTPAQQAAYLEPILRGDEIWCQLFSEPDAGSDLAAVATKATLEGDQWVVHGQKVWTSDAFHADRALLLARTEPDPALRTRGLTYLVCDMRAPGVTVRPLRQMTGDAEFAEVFLDGVRLPADAVVGGRGRGWAVANYTLAVERGLEFPLRARAAEQVVLDRLLEQARALGPGLAPTVRQRLARDVTEAHLFRWITLDVLGRLNRGEELDARTSLVKQRYCELVQHLHGTAAALAGPRAIAGDPADWYGLLLHRSASIAGGTSEIQRTVIAERLLGLPR